ncbi:hypothetical protein [Photobacterium leiognathi]|uniref:hypothetical protein n=1 Tax=Photobacterium leiognathi TaxID=553611 RepID=UPI002981A4BC|nr:hypothetical protein [Photobacterium leiognathi]
MVMNKEIEIRLKDDVLGRKFKVVKGTGNYCELDYPCNGCMHSVFNVDHYCCKLLPFGWTEWYEFYGENVYPYEEIMSSVKSKLHRRIQFPYEDVYFYSCESLNKVSF